ncbi:DUF459 domain-containing protein [Rhizobiaceae bacterium BDR2-2]|uniref:DUF459 domain-containing protein n=1 Tax=Ectorhizobium quercum TaxID=2965071 RepID=A0AAE3SU38_9HYPH|nr:GDSL-type esterase/lipase family protein [Ectorhizobium quercum]MCX8996830.1 DUF459 domain-containing protein [Ectorhizobium quercum]
MRSLQKNTVSGPAAAKAGRFRTAGVLLTAVLVFAAAPLAEAQERRTLIDMLFGRQKQAPDWSAYPPPPPPPARRSSQQRPRTDAGTPAATDPAVQPVPKREDARTVLVVGDFLASGLADGLTEAFAESPGIAVTGRSNGSSGLVREDFYNWQQELPTVLQEVNPAALVILLGANDRQQIDIPQGRERFGSEEWLAEYARRASALALAASMRDIPLIWVGLPPFRSPSMTTDVVTLNRILRGAVEKSGGTFIDIWDGFADEGGKFVTTGSDINGKPVRLRGTDGVGLTGPGKRKLAFYIEKPLKSLLGETDESPDSLQLDADSLPDILSLSPSRLDLPARTAPVALTDPELDGGSELLGARASPARHVLSPREQLLERGELPSAPGGRADNAALPGPTP